MEFGDGLVKQGGVWVPRDEASSTDPYRQVWETEAADDPVRSATARRAAPERTVASLTPKMGKCWESTPAGLAYGTILEVGPGYGRVPLFLTHQRGMTCRQYIGVDISLNMLQELHRNKEEFGLLGGAEVDLICQSGQDFPVPDDSVDLVTASAVFLHMGKSYVKQTLTDLARILRPGGHVVFDVCFPNRRGAANRIGVWRSHLPLKRQPHHLKFWSLAELEEVIDSTGLRAKCPGIFVDAHTLARWPTSILGFNVPWARKANAQLQNPPPALRERYAVTFGVYHVPWATEPGCFGN